MAAGDMAGVVITAAGVVITAVGAVTVRVGAVAGDTDEVGVAAEAAIRTGATIAITTTGTSTTKSSLGA